MGVGGGGGGGGASYYFSGYAGSIPFISITLDKVFMALTNIGSTVFNIANLLSMSLTYGWKL